ncbi:MAG: histidine kinase [Oscillospiraceae bacterium]|nr:histidine kinase [Oscillospiraceae bacterium]
MRNVWAPKTWFLLCHSAGIGLLFALWLAGGGIEGSTTGFFLLLILTVMALFRWRFPNLTGTVAIDIVACIALSATGGDVPFALALPLFAAMYFGLHWAVFAGLYLFFDFNPLLVSVLGLAALAGLFLGHWQRERQEKYNLRDRSVGRYFELESIQRDLSVALARVEQMTVVAERTRIARDIHDNAGHEIVAAYISLQTARRIMTGENPDALELYDAALARLDSGANKIREAVHNLSAVTFLGVEALSEICNKFPACQADFHVYGDTSKIPMYIWNMLEACLKEGLTNAVRHAVATRVTVDLDATPHIVRLCIENDGVIGAKNSTLGSGLRNLRQRAAAIGGSLSVHAGDTFRVVCVIPIKEEAPQDDNEAINR